MDKLKTHKRQVGWIKITAITVLLFVIWLVIHIPLIQYGVENVPMYKSYVGDEQSPVNGALHILEEKSLLGLRNHETLYYGPIFSVIALPAILSDFASLLALGKVHSALEYKEFLLWDWGGIIWKIRLLALTFGFLGLIAFYLLLNTRTINPTQNTRLPIVGTLILSVNFLFFEYATFFRHWIFMVSIFFAQFYFLVKIVENDENSSKKYWIYEIALSLVSFGINYVSIFLQLMWLPILAKWLKEKNYLFFFRFTIYFAFVLLGAVLIVWWHPHAFFRMVGLIQQPGVIGDMLRIEPKTFSYLYYGKTLLNDLFPLWPTWIVMVAYLIYSKKIHKLFWFWIPILTGFSYYVFFGSFTHHEARYVLPTVTAFLISYFSLLVYYSEFLFSKRLWRATLVLTLFFTLIYHSASIYLVSEKFYSSGPEERALIAVLTEKQKENENFSALVVGGDILGVSHTKEAYADYVQKCGKRGARTYEELIESSPPKTATPVNAYYHCVSSAPKKGEREKYDLTVYVVRAPLEIDYFDFEIPSLLFIEDFSTKYIVVPREGPVAII